jgi:parvulin-like peptidyl-prolyl isomerase
MKKRSKTVVITLSAVTVLLSLCIAYALVNFPVGSTIYLSADTENLRAAPKGDRLAVVSKGTPMMVLDNQANWVKVRLEGWIWKESVTDSKLAFKEGYYRASQIIVKEKEKAEKLLEQLRGGADFSQIAIKHSIGPAAQKGGDLGFFQKGDFQAIIENAILGLKPGEVSGIIESDLGYHIFKRIQ